MTTIVVNEALRGLLPDLSRPVEFRDENGHVLGRFLPETGMPAIAIVVGQQEPPPLSEAELRRRENEPTYTTAEVLAYLDALQ
jgi:hypothetical protein